MSSVICVLVNSHRPWHTGSLIPLWLDGLQFASNDDLNHTISGSNHENEVVHDWLAMSGFANGATVELAFTGTISTTTATAPGVTSPFNPGDLWTATFTYAHPHPADSITFETAQWFVSGQVDFKASMYRYAAVDFIVHVETPVVATFSGITQQVGGPPDSTLQYTADFTSFAPLIVNTQSSSLPASFRRLEFSLDADLSVGCFWPGLVVALEHVVVVHHPASYRARGSDVGGRRPVVGGEAKGTGYWGTGPPPRRSRVGRVSHPPSPASRADLWASRPRRARFASRAPRNWMGGTPGVAPGTRATAGETPARTRDKRRYPGHTPYPKPLASPRGISVLPPRCRVPRCAANGQLPCAHGRLFA